MQRREFLLPALAPPPDAALVRLGWRAMATGWEIAVPVGRAGGRDAPQTPLRDPLPAGRDAFALLDRLEDQLTVYRDASEVSRLNRSAPTRAVRVEQRLFALLKLAGELHAATGGAFDAATGRLIKAWGFFKGPKRVPGPEELAAAMNASGWHQVSLDEAARTVRFSAPVEINLGSVGKGYALDRLAERLFSRWKIHAALLHGGSSSVYARGCPHGAGWGWAIDIRQPWHHQRRLARVRLLNRAMGTSAATFQHLEHEGRRLGHVLDPRTGWPASGVASASALAPTAAEADALSTAFFVGGVALAERICRDRQDIGAVILPDGADTPLTIGNVVTEA